jgi:hypothetical protein
MTIITQSVTDLTPSTRENVQLHLDSAWNQDAFARRRPLSWTTKEPSTKN